MKNLSNRSTAANQLALDHARHMFLYYFLRAQLETDGMVADGERTVTHEYAVESRRFGFRLEVKGERIGLILDQYDEEGLRREAYRAAQHSATDPAKATEIENRIVAEIAMRALNTPAEEYVAMPKAA